MATTNEVVRTSAISCVLLSGLFFFFQAEDGIRDLTVTGVQTCALPICFHGSFRCRLGEQPRERRPPVRERVRARFPRAIRQPGDRGRDDAVERAERSEEHTLNSSHSQISYAVFCLKKKTNTINYTSAIC